MYIKIGKIKQLKQERGTSTMITHIGLYKDDGVWIKWLPHDEEFMDRLTNIKLETTIPEIGKYLKEHEIDKLIPPTQEQSLF